MQDQVWEYLPKPTMMRGRLILCVAITLIWGQAALIGADALRYVAKPGGAKVTIEGTSTVHDWVIEGKIIGGFFQVESSLRSDLTLRSVESVLGQTNPPNVEVFIPVTSLKSTVLAGREKMDEVMREAMRATDSPRITYKLTSMKLKGQVPESGSPVKFDTKGELQVAGVTNVIEMEVTMERLEGDRLRFTGSKKLKMTDFKITPPAPKLAMGLIRTGDEVTVKFDWIVGLSAGP